jgi:outer membrane protein assembly factor BamB
MKTNNILVPWAMGALSLAAILHAVTLFASPTTLKWRANIGNNGPGSPALGPDGEIYVAVKDTLYKIRDETNRPVALCLYWPSLAGIQGGVAVRPDGIAYLPGISSGPAGVTAVSLSGTTLGSTVWYYSTQGHCGFQTTPAIGPDGTVCAVSGTGELHIIDPDTGIKTYSRSGDAAPNNNVSPAIATDGTIYFRQYGSQIHAVLPNGTNRWIRPLEYQVNSSPAIGADGTIYVCAESRLFALNPEDGFDRWTPLNLGTQVFFSSPAIGPDGTLYVGGANRDVGLLYAVDTATGLEKAPRFPTGAEIYSSPAVAADGTIYFGSNDKYFYAVRLTTNGFSLIDRYLTGGKVQGSPVIASNGAVYVTAEDGYLYAFQGTAGPASSAWPMFHQNAQRTGLAPQNPRLFVPQSPSGTFHVRIFASADRRTVLETSTDLVHWDPVLTNTSVTTQIDYQDPAPLSSAKRFYRGVIR